MKVQQLVYDLQNVIRLMGDEEHEEALEQLQGIVIEVSFLRDDEKQSTELEQVKGERDAMREALKSLATLGTTISDSDYAKGWNHAVCVVRSFAKDTLKDAK